ncbi:MAG: S41 family peptidase [Planctomycetota bacterium]|jgi:carboxyl-terminal processing protease
MKKRGPLLTSLQNVRTAILFIVLIMWGLIVRSPAYAVEVVPECNKPRTEERYDPNGYFDKVWQTINDEFWDANFNGVDWQEGRKRYKPKALAAKDHESFAVVVNQMLAELKTSHTRYFTRWDPDYYTLQAVFKSAVLAEVSAEEISALEKYLSELRSSKREPHRSGIGVVTKNIGARHYVTAVLASSPAEKAGVVLGDWLVEVNGRAFHPIRSFENMAGQELEITIQRGRSISTRRRLKVIPLDMKEQGLFENDSRASLKSIEYKGHKFAYVRLWWLSGLAMRQVFEAGLNKAEASEGMIIDIRDGFGGGPYEEYIDPFLRRGSDPIVVESLYRAGTEKSTVGFNKPVIVLEVIPKPSEGG